MLDTRHELAAVPVVPHPIGLAIAGLIYALLLRLGVRRWAAALAAAPILLDAYQLRFEQYVLSEALFELFLIAGCAALPPTSSPGATSWSCSCCFRPRRRSG
jgi:hypothetical protein